MTGRGERSNTPLAPLIFCLGNLFQERNVNFPIEQRKDKKLWRTGWE